MAAGRRSRAAVPGALGQLMRPMWALCLEAPRQLNVRKVETPVPQAGEVLVRIRACGVCASDLNAWRGVQGIEYPLPAGAPGHETWGDIALLGPDVRGLQVGQPVTGLMWNGLAEFGVARAEHLVALTDDRPLLGEPLACAMNVVRRARVGSDRVAVVGLGYLGALIVQLLPSGMQWIACARREESEALALQLGADAAYSFSAIPR